MTWALFISDRFHDSPEHRIIGGDGLLLAAHMGSWCAVHETRMIPKVALRHDHPFPTYKPVPGIADKLVHARVWDRDERSGGYRWRSPHFKLAESTETRNHGVYHCWSGNDLTYVGVSHAPDSRIALQRKHRDIHWVCVDWYAERKQALAEEAFAIRLFQPPDNTAGAQDD